MVVAQGIRVLTARPLHPVVIRPRALMASAFKAGPRARVLVQARATVATSAKLFWMPALVINV